MNVPHPVDIIGFHARAACVLLLLFSAACSGRGGAEDGAAALTREEIDYLDEWASRLVEIWMSYPPPAGGNIDSLLAERGCTASDLQELIDRCDSDPEIFYPYLYGALADAASEMELPPPDCPAQGSQAPPGPPSTEEGGAEGEETR